MKKRKLNLILLALLLTACATNTSPTIKPDPVPTEAVLDTVVAEGKLLPAPSVELAFAQPGIVDEVLLEPGQEVAAGEVIARTRNFEALQAEEARAEQAYLLAEQAFGRAEALALSDLSGANEAVRQAQYELDNFDVPSDQRDMTASEALVHTYDALEAAREAFEPYRHLEERLEKELERDDPANPKVYRNTAKTYKKRLDDAWAEYDKAIRRAELEANLESARARRVQAGQELEALLHEDLAGEETSVARAQYESAFAHLTAARAALAGCELRAPFPGRLLSLELAAGETALPGVPVAFVADTAHWQVETTDLAEIDIARVALQDAVTIRLDAFPGEEFSGKVVKIDPVGREYLGDMTYEVTVLLDAADERFMWNMTAIVTIHTKGLPGEQ